MRLLLAEDNRELAHWLEKALVQNGFAVDCVFDGQSADHLLHSETYALAVLDINMPGLNGLEVLEQPDTALVTLHEGKYHQIKRMLAARGKPVVYLKRLTMGPLMLDPVLERGEWRPLSAEEVAALRQA